MKFPRFVWNVLILLILLIPVCCHTTYKLYNEGTPSEMITELWNTPIWDDQNKKLTSGIAIVESFDEKKIFEKSLQELATDTDLHPDFLQKLKIQVGHHSLTVRFYVEKKVYGEKYAGKQKVTETYNLSPTSRTLYFEAMPGKKYLLLAWGRSSWSDPDWANSWYVWIQEQLHPWILGDVVAGTSPEHVQDGIQRRNEYWKKRKKKK